MNERMERLQHEREEMEGKLEEERQSRASQFEDDEEGDELEELSPAVAPEDPAKAALGSNLTKSASSFAQKLGLWVEAFSQADAAPAVGFRALLGKTFEHALPSLRIERKSVLGLVARSENEYGVDVSGLRTTLSRPWESLLNRICQLDAELRSLPDVPARRSSILEGGLTAWLAAIEEQGKDLNRLAQRVEDLVGAAQKEVQVLLPARNESGFFGRLFKGKPDAAPVLEAVNRIFLASCPGVEVAKYAFEEAELSSQSLIEPWSILEAQWPGEIEPLKSPAQKTVRGLLEHRAALRKRVETHWSTFRDLAENARETLRR